MVSWYRSALAVCQKIKIRDLRLTKTRPIDPGRVYIGCIYLVPRLPPGNAILEALPLILP